MANFRGVILDIDGTLLDSNLAHAQAFAQAFAEHDLEHSIEEIRWCIGMGSDHLLPHLSGISSQSGLGVRILQRKKEIFDRVHLPQLKPLPRALDLVRELAQRGFCVVVGTSAGKEDARHFIDLIGMGGYLSHVITASAVRASKPDPDLIEAALQAMDLAPSQVVMLGDTPYDIESARRAGVATIAVRSGGWIQRAGNDALARAIAVYEGPAELLSRLSDSPLAECASEHPNSARS